MLFNWNDFPFQVVILGSGKDYIESKANYLAEVFKGKVFAQTGKYDEALSHKIYAASDIFVMPSKFEPCGLSQMIAMRYGCVIAAGDTGGLHDTVSDITNPDAKNPSGILVQYTDSNGIAWALNSLYNIYASGISGEESRKSAGKEKGMDRGWSDIVINSANKHFGWEDSAKVYEGLYYDIIK